MWTMIPEIKKRLKKFTPKPIFKAIYILYAFSFSYIVKSTRYLYVSLFFKSPTVITIRDTELKLLIDPTNGYTDKNLFLFKERDVELTELMKKHITRGDTIIDVGANIGYETIWGAHLVGKSGHVYSFEPLKKLVDQIQVSLSENKFENVTIISKAVGEKSGEIAIYSHPEDAGLTSVENKAGATDSTVVPITTLDQELGSINSVSFIKIDIEGYEFEALQGGKNLIEKYHPYIVFEFTSSLYEQAREGKSKKLLFYLMDMGYTVSVLGEQHSIAKDSVESFVDSMLQDNKMVNMVAEYIS